MNEINEQFNTENKNKKSPIFYLAIIALAISVVGVTIVIVNFVSNADDIVNIDKKEKLEQLSQDDSIPKMTEEEQLGILEQLSQDDSIPKMTEKEQLDILKELSAQQ